MMEMPECWVRVMDVDSVVCSITFQGTVTELRTLLSEMQVLASSDVVMVSMEDAIEKALDELTDKISVDFKGGENDV